MPDSVAVIDIGSNTIKLLVAARLPAGGIETLQYAVDEARLGRGLGAGNLVLSHEAMTRGRNAVQHLLHQAAAHAPKQVAIVATSAVRDAANGEEFAHLIRTTTGHPVRILSGNEEADAIGRGLAADPALAGAEDFYLFDLGGGSLECIEFRQRRSAQAASLQLGCVRLAERCLADPAAPFSSADRASVAAAVGDAFAEGAFRFTLPRPTAAVATGGTVTTVRVMLAAQAGDEAATARTTVTTRDLERLLALTAAQPLASRREIPGLPAARADVFPTALATILEVARLAGVAQFTHSFYNLRYGIADTLLT